MLEVISDANYEEELFAADKPVILDFFEDWCGPCKLIEPLLAQLHEEGEVKVVKAKPGNTPKLAKWLKKHGANFRVGALPHVILIENGKPAKSLVGRFDAARLKTFVGGAAEAVRGVVLPAPQKEHGGGKVPLQQIGCQAAFNYVDKAADPIPLPIRFGASPPPL